MHEITTTPKRFKNHHETNTVCQLVTEHFIKLI